MRKEYLSKNKELNRKQAQLAELSEQEGRRDQEKRQRAAEREATQKTRNNRGSHSAKPVSVEPAGSDTPGLSPSLEKRLSGIEGKLDEVLRALTELKRQGAPVNRLRKAGFVTHARHWIDANPRVTNAKVFCRNRAMLEGKCRRLALATSSPSQSQRATNPDPHPY